MFRITDGPSSGSLVQCLAKNYKYDSIVSVDMENFGVMAAFATCWRIFKYFIILTVPTYYILCISWIIKRLIRKTGFLMNKKEYRNSRVFQNKHWILLERDYIHLHDNFKTVIPGYLCLKVSVQPARSHTILHLCKNLWNGMFFRSNIL